MEEAGGKKIVLKNREGSNSLLREERTETEVICVSETQEKGCENPDRNGSYCLNEEVGMESDEYYLTR